MIGELEKINEWKDHEIYRTSCSCMSDDHIITMSFDADDQGIKTATFYYPTILKGWWRERGHCIDWKDWLSSLIPYYVDTIKYRVKAALRILFTGYLEMEGDFTFRGDKQILAVAEALINLVQCDKEKPSNEKKDPCDGSIAGPNCPNPPEQC